MKSREELKLQAKKALSGKILISFAVLIVPILINGLPSSLFAKFEDSQGAISTLFGLLMTIVTIALMPMRTGLKLYFLNLHKGQGENFNNLFAPYKNGWAWEIIKAKLLSGIYIVLGLILFIVPGIILAFKYAMIDYIIADKKDIKYNQAMKDSGVIMQGNKARLFVLALSFIGWFFVIIITFGFAYIYVAPYFEATIAGFYNDIKKPLPEPDIDLTKKQDVFNDF